MYFYHRQAHIFRFKQICRLVLIIGGFAMMASLIASPTLAGAVSSGDFVTKASDKNFKVWDVARNRFIARQDFLSRLVSARFLILGEVHDNALHHQIRANIVRDLLEIRRDQKPTEPRPAAVFEHGTTDRQSHLDAITRGYDTQQSAQQTPNKFYEAVQWKKRGWPGGGIFDPLVRAVMSARLALFAGDVPRAKIMAVVGGGAQDTAKPLSEADRERLGLDVSLGEVQNAASLDEIAQAHCGVMPESMLPPMAFAQRLRDATLADTMLNAAKKYQTAILFTGNGHARTDRGVPWYLQHRGKRQIISVLMKETEDLAADRKKTLAADYVIWTPSYKRPDPCAKLKEKYGKTKG